MDTTTRTSNAPYTDGHTTVIVHPRYRAALKTVQRLPEIFDTDGITLYRGRNVVKRFDTDNGTWVVKRYKRPNRVQRIAYTFFKKSKAERAYRYARLMRERGIDTPEGIACILQKHNGLLQDSYFIATLCTYRPVFPELVPTEHYDRRLAYCLADFLVHMHRQGVMHGDLNLNNILYTRDADGRIHFCVIDTNRSKIKDRPTRRECLNNLKRVTHRRDLLQDIVAQYARLRGWNAERCTRRVLKALKRFERQKKLRRMFRFAD